MIFNSLTSIKKMTKNIDNKEVQGIQAPQINPLKWLEADLWALIADESSGLSDLASFAKNLTHKNEEKKLTKHNLHIIKQDLQDGWLVDFEWWERNGIHFWFEVIWNDIEPTLTPNGDCIIPINFRYDSQRRTKLLVIHIKDENWENVYSIPNWDNKYEIQIWKELWTYSLSQDEKGFHLLINN
jgi:hypothetical protein